MKKIRNNSKKERSQWGKDRKNCNHLKKTRGNQRSSQGVLGRFQDAAAIPSAERQAWREWKVGWVGLLFKRKLGRSRSLFNVLCWFFKEVMSHESKSDVFRCLFSESNSFSRQPRGYRFAVLHAAAELQYLDEEVTLHGLCSSGPFFKGFQIVFRDVLIVFRDFLIVFRDFLIVSNDHLAVFRVFLRVFLRVFKSFDWFSHWFLMVFMDFPVLNGFDAVLRETLKVPLV